MCRLEVAHGRLRAGAEDPVDATADLDAVIDQRLLERRDGRPAGALGQTEQLARCQATTGEASHPADLLTGRKL